MTAADVRPELRRVTGTVLEFRDASGMGWLTPDTGGPVVFVHAHVIAGQTGRRTLVAGQRVAFDVEHSDKGLRARNVLVLPRA
jgi:CspA family cold shock protein